MSQTTSTMDRLESASGRQASDTVIAYTANAQIASKTLTSISGMAP